MTYHRISARGRHLFVPYNGKIADITHADTNKHTLDLAAALGETRTIIAVILNVARIAGTGDFRVYPNEGAKFLYIEMWNQSDFVVIASNSQRLQYNQTVANDDFDLYCLGYVVET